MQINKNYVLISLSLLMITFVFAGCTSVTVNRDYDTLYDFSELKSFSILPVPASAGIDPMNAALVGKAIDSVLTGKGYILLNEADFGIAIHFGTKTQKNIDTYSYGYGYGEWGRTGMGGVEIAQYNEGVLIIDIVDMEKKFLIWRGTGSGIIRTTVDVEERTARINYVVQKILAKFPPNRPE